MNATQTLSLDRENAIYVAREERDEKRGWNFFFSDGTYAYWFQWCGWWYRQHSTEGEACFLPSGRRFF